MSASLSRRASLAGLALVLGLCALPSRADAPVKKAPEPARAVQTVSVIIDSGQGQKRVVEGLPWREGLTAWEATRAASRRTPGFSLKHSGEGAMVFITEIDGLKNQGGGADKRNWQLWVNEAYSDAGVGAKVLRAGDTVRWSFAPPPPRAN